MSHDGTAADSYLRVAVVTSSHPANDLAGNVLALSTSLDIDMDSEILGDIISAGAERFDPDEYATNLRVGTMFITNDTQEIVGVEWHESPIPYEHNELTDPVTQLPDSLTPIDEIENESP